MRVIDRSAVKIVPKGQVLFREGELGDCAYIINKGRIQIYVGTDEEPTPVSVLGVGEIFGEMSILDGSPRSASALALDECELTPVSRDQVTSRVDQADPIVRFLIFFLLKRMRENAKQVGSGTDFLIDPKGDLAKDQKANNEAVLSKIRFEGELLRALEDDNFHLHYQPIVELKTQKIVGFEALIRWNCPDRGMVRPDVFMGVAEESSLIVPIGQWVLRKAVEELKNLRAQVKAKKGKETPLFMGINVSAKQFADPSFFSQLEKLPKELKIDPKDIKLEITERVLLQGATVNHWIDRCRNLGYNIALDDFGTGYSSLSYLEQFEVDVLKVDQSFVRRLTEQKRAGVIVASIVNLAQGLGIPVVAEGIETKEQADQLIGLNCKFGQGYYFGRPMTAEAAIEALLKAD